MLASPAWKVLAAAGETPLVLARDEPRAVALTFSPGESDLVLRRAWPLLTGERAHYELAAGREAEAFEVVQAAIPHAGGSVGEHGWCPVDR